MCKACIELQSCDYKHNGLNPNIMLEQGVAYVLGKPVTKDKNTQAISDLASIEYIVYAYVYDCSKNCLLH
jgi:hypothetical protein